jgi:hypothetical protein
MLTPLWELAVRLPIPMLGGGGMLKELLLAGLGGGMLNDEYRLFWLRVCDGT